MQKNKEKAVSGLTGGIEGLFKKYKVTYVKGFGKLSSPNTVSVDLNAGGNQVIDAKNIILAVGSEVTPLPTVPVDNAGQKIVDSTGALALQSVPKRLAVIGGGVIGLEMGSVWARLGSEVCFFFFLYSPYVSLLLRLQSLSFSIPSPLPSTRRSPRASKRSFRNKASNSN